MIKQIEPTNEKFTESFELDEWEIETEDGWKDITHLHKTVKYDVWELNTISHSLKCADDHIVMVDGMKEKFVKDLTEDDKVITKSGLQKVISVKKLKVEPEEMFDLTVNSKNHTLFTNGILSHNTTVSTIFLLWYALFNKDKTVAIVAHKQEAAIDILKRIKMAIGMLPLWLQQGLTDDGWNKKSVQFGNGSRIVAQATSAEALTSLTVNLLFLDEFAKVPSHVAEEFITSTYPVISSGKTCKIIMISTPKGLNHFYEFWSKAVRRERANNFFPIRVGWWEVPGRDDEWKEEMIADIGPVRFAQEFSCKFLGSQSTLIDSDVLERIDFKDPVAMKWNGLLRIYKAPIKGAEYVLGVDTGKGTGRDYSVIQVLWIKNEYDIEQVATYRSNMIRPHDFAQVAVSIAKYYNSAHMMVENNDIGQSVADSVWHEYEYEELINVDPKGLGIRSTKKTKLRANMLLKEYLEKDRLFICDESTLYELSRYEEVRPNVFAAGRHDHDDCFKEDALVKTKRGYIPIIDVKIGDEVLTHMGRWRKVTNLIKKEFDGEWYDIKFKGQLNLSCSYNHPIYTSIREWVFARDWKDQSCVSVKMPIKDNKNEIYLYEDYIESKGNNKKINIKMDSSFAKFLGLFLADGHAYKNGKKYHYRMTIAFDKKHTELINEMKEYLNSIGISSSLKYEKHNNGCTIQFANKFLHYFMSQCYDDVRNKVLPPYAFNLGHDLKYVLEYWLKGDGWYCNRVGKTHHVIGATISKKLALDMRDIAISIGKKANIQHVVKHKLNEKDQYYVTVYDEYNEKCNSQSINEISNFEIGHKISKLKKVNQIKKSQFKGIVYNISVDEDESFVCDGIVVHNCVTSLLWALYFVITDDYEGKNYDTKHVENDYNVQYGDWEHDEVSPMDGLEEQGDPKWRPSVVFDDDIMQ